MKHLYPLIILVFLLNSCENKKETKIPEPEIVESISNPYSAKDKKLEVYTTASETDLRLSKTENLSFASARQPLRMKFPYL